MEISSKELRLGNWININGSPFQIELPDLNLIANKNSKSTYEPIELTEEWLLKLGFVIDYMNKDVLICAYYGNNPLTKDYILELKNVGDGWFYRNGYFKMKYVHQPQNLIHSLCGEELTIKEQK